MEGLRLYLFHAAEHATQEVNEAFRYALRSSLMELNVSRSLLQDRAEQLKDETLLAPLSSLSRSFSRLNRMIANLSVIQNAAAGALVFHPVLLDLCPFLRDLRDSVSVLFPAPELRLHMPETLRTAADPALLETLLLNLLSNAILHARGCTRICLSLHAARDQLILSVDDDGCGIPPAGLQHVFDRYRHGFALSAMANGAGFGLTAVREIAHIHGGTLLLESREGSGTAVRVSMSRSLSVPDPVLDAEPPYERSYNSILTGLADCLPPSAFNGTFFS
jgi:two-component system sensor histidine kinase KdpD